MGYSVISDSNVQSESVTNTTSKLNSSMIQSARHVELRLGGEERAVPRTPAIMTGIVTGYNRIGSSTSRLRARASMAANSVPTLAKPTVPTTSSAATSSRSARTASPGTDSATSGTMTTSVASSSAMMPSELADVDGRPRARRQQQRPERIAVTFALERPAERERAGKRDRDPENAGGRIPYRASIAALAHERHGKHHHARDGEEHGRIDQLTASRFDREILPRHDPHDAPERIHDARPAMSRRCLIPARAGRARPARVATSRPSCRMTARSSTASATSRSCVATSVMQPADRSSRNRLDQRCRRRIVQPGERLVEQQQARAVQQRTLERQTLAHAAREARDQVAAAIAETRALERVARELPRALPTPYSVPKNTRFSRAVSSE